MQVQAASAAGVSHLIVVSVITADERESVFGQQFQQIEDVVKATTASGSKYTLVRLPLFLENYYGFTGSVRTEGKIRCCIDASQLYSPIAVTDIGEALAAIAADTRGSYLDKTVSLVSSCLVRTVSSDGTPLVAISHQPVPARRARPLLVTPPRPPVVRCTTLASLTRSLHPLHPLHRHLVVASLLPSCCLVVVTWSLPRCCCNFVVPSSLHHLVTFPSSRRYNRRVSRTRSLHL